MGVKSANWALFALPRHRSMHWRELHVQYSKKVAHVAVARKKMVWPQWRKKIARIRSISEPIFAFQSKFSNILIFILGY